MARRRNIVGAMHPWHVQKLNPGEKDPLVGRHVEDYLSTDNGGEYHPVTPVQAQLMGPNEDDEEMKHREFMRGWTDEAAIKRDSWDRQEQHGGKTYKRGSILGDY